MCMSFVYANPQYVILAADSAFFSIDRAGRVSVTSSPDRLVRCPWGYLAAAGANGEAAKAGREALRRMPAGDIGELGRTLNTAFMRGFAEIYEDWAFDGGRRMATATFHAIGAGPQGHWAAHFGTVGELMGAFWPWGIVGRGVDTRPGFYAWATPFGVPDPPYSRLHREMTRLAAGTPPSVLEAVRQIAGFFLEARRVTTWMNDDFQFAGFARRGNGTVEFGIVHTTAEAAVKASDSQILDWINTDTKEAA